MVKNGKQYNGLISVIVYKKVNRIYFKMMNKQQIINDHQITHTCTMNKINVLENWFMFMQPYRNLNLHRILTLRFLQNFPVFANCPYDVDKRAITAYVLGRSIQVFTKS